MSRHPRQSTGVVWDGCISKWLTVTGSNQGLVGPLSATFFRGPNTGPEDLLNTTEPFERAALLSPNAVGTFC